MSDAGQPHPALKDRMTGFQTQHATPRVPQLLGVTSNMLWRLHLGQHIPLERRVIYAVTNEAVPNGPKESKR